MRSRRWQALYTHPETGERLTGPATFSTKADATRWLSTIEADLHRGDDLDPSGRSLRFGPYARRWLAAKTNLRPHTIELYSYLLNCHILPHLSENKEFLTMFVDEAKMVAGLTHPNIVQIYDLGRIDASYYIAMEYVHGHDLRSITKRALNKGLRMPLDLSLRVVSQVCSALEYAHRKKDESGRPMEIVHRDVSPQNILISFEGNVKLADFGIAKALTEGSHTDLTSEAGHVLGTATYLSPEQARGDKVGPRSDVYSLAVVLYEMMTGRPPFIGDSSMEIARQHVELAPQPPSRLGVGRASVRSWSVPVSPS